MTTPMTDPIDGATLHSSGSSLSTTDEKSLRALAARRARTSWGAESIATWLVMRGMTEGEAAKVAQDACRDAELSAKREAAERQVALTLGWSEIAGGVALLIGGLFAGWLIGLALVPIIDGARRVSA